MKDFTKNRDSYYSKRDNKNKLNDSKKSLEFYCWFVSPEMKGKPKSMEAYMASGGLVELKYQMVETAKKGESLAEKQFNELAAKWRKETGGYSTMIHIAGNNNYLDIIGMGKDVLPYIIKDLQKEPDYWFVALKHITKENPVPKEHIGDIDKMAEDWLNWARENKII
jgi:hypothetical protein